MRAFFILITAILAGFVAVCVHIYLGSGLFAGVFSFTLYYLTWELTVRRLRAIVQAEHPEHLAVPRYDVHITADHLKDDRQD